MCSVYTKNQLRNCMRKALQLLQLHAWRSYFWECTSQLVPQKVLRFGLLRKHFRFITDAYKSLLSCITLSLLTI